MTSAAFTIHLIRHGEVHNPGQILYGRLPRFRLSANGRQQARRTGRRLRGRSLDALITSPLLRARQTAEQIRLENRHLGISVSNLINEVHTSYEGRPGAEVDALDGDVYTGAGEGFEQPGDIVARTRKLIRRLRRGYAGGEVAAVSHGDVVTFMVLWASGMAVVPNNKTRLLEAGFPESYPAHASITTLTYRNRDPEARPLVAYHRP